MTAENVTCPDDFDPEDVEMAKSLVEDGAFVTSMIVVVAWMSPEGTQHWRCYNATSETKTSELVGLIEYAKLHMIAASNTGLPLRYDPDE